MQQMFQVKEAVMTPSTAQTRVLQGKQTKYDEV